MTPASDPLAELIAELEKTRNFTEFAPRIARYGQAAIERLIPILAAGESEIATSPPAWLFQHFGAEAVEPLITALRAGHPEKANAHFRYALAELDIADRAAAFLPLFADDAAPVREGAVAALSGHDDAVQQHAEAILAMMADPDGDVRIAAYNTLGSAGRDLVPFLLRARRTAAKVARPELREMLLELVGFQGMDTRDQVAIRRFLEVQALDEEPAPMHLCGSWLALPTEDQDRVLRALDLSDPLTVPMSLGADAWNRDHHDWYSHSSCRRSYITPAIDGWTLAFGISPEVEHAEDHKPETMFALVQQECRRLSAEFGEAHWYGTSCGDGWTSWCVARAGEIVRFYDAFEPEMQIGEALPEEEDGGYAETVAGLLSVNPGELGPDNTVRGRRVLALTSCGRERGMPTGALHLDHGH
ncbi:hypothetical protein ABH926_005571 [Catenulispora sp. GP43]|uniref:HEAT repeat domain-containing protein n=1 Tax=Catenulispora sp. GP43 TaxID=3156263 RepID=UPI003518206D